MQVAELARIDHPEATVCLKKTPPKVMIYDVEALPDELVRIVREPDKLEIKKRLEAGEEVDGAAMSNGGLALQVRR
jgi:hypothetical protein